MTIKKNNLIEKRNVLNEIRCNNMHLQELRFFTIYLSRINARNPEKTRLVRFTLSDFLAIMELNKVNIADLKQTTNSLLCKVVNVPTESGGYRAFQLFKECTVEKDKNSDEWYIEIDAHDRALPLMFDFKRDYFTYELWNALRLTSSNQLRMYEILKQYEKKGYRIIGVDELKKLLYLDEKEYSRFGDFKIWVLNVCQKALKENTDIYFEYELIKKGRGGKVSEIRFTIGKNKNYIDKLTLSEFITVKNNTIIDAQGDDADIDMVGEMPENEEPIITNAYQDRLQFFSEALRDEFDIAQVEVLYKIAISFLADKKYKHGLDAGIYDYFSLKYTELNTKKNVKYRFNYLKKLMELDCDTI